MNRNFALALTLALTLAACGKDTSVTVGDGQEVQINTYMPVGEVKDPAHGKETFLSYGAMSGAGEYKANGVSTMHVFEDGSSNIGIQLNITVAPDKQFYEAWAVKTGEPAWVSLGHVNSVLGDARHARISSQKNDLSTYTKIIVTLEKDDGNPAPSTVVVAQGMLKPTNR